MIISKTPYRISYFGGGTDYPEWYLKYGGQVLSSSIDKYVYITCRHLPPFFKHNIRIVYSKMEYCNNVKQVKHPIVRAVLNELNIKNNIEIHYDGDLPARSGIGSSSSFTVGLLNSLLEYKKNKISKKNLLEKAIYVERILNKENVGSQDQTSATYGGLNHIKFNKNGKIIINKINLNKKDLKNFQQKFMLFHTGIFRIADKITKTYVDKLQVKYAELDKIKNHVNHAIKYLYDKQFDSFGNLLDETWHHKRQISKNISNSTIDEIYKIAIDNGALGGKLLGAGGGGLILFYVPENSQQKLIKKLSKLTYIPFKISFEGSRIIYNSNNKFINE